LLDKTSATCAERHSANIVLSKEIYSLTDLPSRRLLGPGTILGKKKNGQRKQNISVTPAVSMNGTAAERSGRWVTE
jgi:hypothetical protein